MPEESIGKPEHTRAIGRRELEASPCPCGDVDCNHMRLSVSCHGRGTPVFVVYRRATGTIQLRCSICNGKSVEIAVADVGPSDA